MFYCLVSYQFLVDFGMYGGYCRVVAFKVIMIFQNLQFSLYSLLHKFKVIPILLLLLITTWGYFSVSLYRRFDPPTNVYFSQCITEFMSKYKTEETIQLLPANSILSIVPVYQGVGAGADGGCEITDESLAPGVQSERMHLFRDLSLEYLPADVKIKHKITQVKMLVNMDKLADKVVYEYFGTYQTLIHNIDKVIREKNLRGIYVRDFSKYQETVEIKNIYVNSLPKVIIHKGVALFLAVLRVFFCSIFAGVMMMTSLIFLVRAFIALGELVLKLTGNNTMLRWVPLMSEYLEGLRNGRKRYMIKYIVVAYLVVSYIIWYGLMIFVDTLLKGALMGVYYTHGNDISFVQTILIEFLAMIVLRTRTSIKHSPPIILTILILTHFLAQLNPYKLPLFYLSLGFQISIIYLIITFLTVQSSVVESRELDRPHKQHPRAMYFPNYNITWHSIIPPLWTYFVPLHSRKFFTQSQLSYVDGSYDRLYCLLMGLPFQGEQNPINPQPQQQLQQQARRERDQNQIQMANNLI